MKGRTTLLITHRRELAMAADRVIVLEGARVVDEGRPADLALRPGVFARLFEIAHTATAGV